MEVVGVTVELNAEVFREMREIRCFEISSAATESTSESVMVMRAQ